MTADVVVINHHLFFADMNVRESGVAELLPCVHCVVFDEAHQLNEIGVQFLGRQLSTGQLTSLCRDIAVQGPQWARGLVNWNLLVLNLDRAIVQLRDIAGVPQASTRRRWDGDCPQGVVQHQWSVAMQGLQDVLRQAFESLDVVAQTHIELGKLQQRVAQLRAVVEHYGRPVEAGCVRWLELGSQVRLVESPLDIAATMRFQIGLGDGALAQRQSWIFTSATLGADASMALFVGSCGLEGAKLMQVQSPFDYATQAAIFIPAHLPKPNDPGHPQAVAALAAQGAIRLKGRTLVLTTTLRAMRTIADALRRQFSQVGDIEVLVQGQASKRELVERFCQGAELRSGGCILVASASFWEGIDIPGDALQLLIIDKLPFSPPDDPLVQARSQQLEAKGENAFKNFHLPHATLALRQGMGRLIRSETDAGVLVICDVRLVQMGYGKKMLAALPPMPVIATQDAFFDALRSLTKVSTTDLGLPP
jgi:ATP-dependent DNA helicase DinG